MIVNRQPRLELVSHEAVEVIHRASLRILAEVGHAYLCDEALDLLEALPGTRVDRDLQRVTFDPAAVEAAVAQLPATITVHARNPKRTVTWGGDNVVFSPTGGCPFAVDQERGRRTGRLEDAIELTKLCASIDELDIVGSGSVEPQDVPVTLRPAVGRYLSVKYSDKPARIGALAPSPGDIDRDIRGDFRTVVEILFGSDWDYVQKPISAGGVNPLSPLCYDDRVSRTIIDEAHFGQPLFIAPAAIAGLSAPMTLAGAMAQHNAEVLAGIMLCHAVRPGNPVTYGTVTAAGDMKTGLPLYAGAEHVLCLSIGAQLARKYGIPSRGGGAMTESKVPDVQAGYERMFLLLSSMLVGNNLITHSAGVLESMLTASYELLVVDADLIGILRRIADGVAVDDEQIALEVIKEVGPQGMFLTTEHTYSHYRRAYFEPRLADRLLYNDWVKRGSKSIVERATERWKELLQSYEAPPLDPHAEQALRELILRDEASIPSGDREDWPRELVGLGQVARLA
ncbi:MAG: trimethylamine methyltransferase family protein [Chloroflexi bacterium]|nr:trimethylamine methyltransferase family protein [Chloroflexota bacterium]